MGRGSNCPIVSGSRTMVAVRVRFREPRMTRGVQHGRDIASPRTPLPQAGPAPRRQAGPRPAAIASGRRRLRAGCRLDPSVDSILPLSGGAGRQQVSGICSHPPLVLRPFASRLTGCASGLTRPATQRHISHATSPPAQDHRVRGRGETAMGARGSACGPFNGAEVSGRIPRSKRVRALCTSSAGQATGRGASRPGPCA